METTIMGDYIGIYIILGLDYGHEKNLAGRVQKTSAVERALSKVLPTVSRRCLAWTSMFEGVGSQLLKQSSLSKP